MRLLGEVFVVDLVFGPLGVLQWIAIDLAIALAMVALSRCRRRLPPDAP